MQRFTSRGPPADGGYPIDRDLHQMTDDGGPQTPNPARWSDPDWRDNIGDQDTFAAEVAMGFPAARRPGVVTVRTPADVTFQRVRKAVGSQALEVTSWSSVVVGGNPTSVWTAHRFHVDGSIGPYG